jgi:uncharacterized protein YqgC (DUF456 family)
MTTFAIIIATILFLLAAATAWLVTVLGLPGTWIMLCLAILFHFLIPDDSRAAIGWPILITLGVLAALGELLEFLASALGAAKAGGSRRGAIFALIGSFMGAIIGGIVGVPIPWIGSMIGVIFFSGVGAMAGAFIGEFSHGKQIQQSFQIGRAAFWGRILGTLSKVLIASIMLAIVVGAVLL